MEAARQNSVDKPDRTKGAVLQRQNRKGVSQEPTPETPKYFCRGLFSDVLSFEIIQRRLM
jgi:hypothetical protein